VTGATVKLVRHLFPVEGSGTEESVGRAIAEHVQSTHLTISAKDASNVTVAMLRASALTGNRDPTWSANE
jgi:hypothetical protein